jgi:hypothetical protein
VAGSCLESEHQVIEKNDTVKSTICKLRTYDRSLLAIRGAIEELEIAKQKQDKKNKITPKKSKNGLNQKALKLENDQKSTQASLTWIDMNFNENLNENDDDNGDDNDSGPGTGIPDRNRNRDSDDDESEEEKEKEKETSTSFPSYSSFTVGDRALEEMYQASDPGTVMLVLTQANIFPLVQLASKKQR